MSTTETKRTPAISVDTIGDTLVFTFSNGEELRLNPSALSEEIRSQAMLHGVKQKLVDAAAIARNPDNGRSATIEDKYDAVKEIYDRITSPDGTWNKVRGDGTGMAGAGLLIRALMEKFGKSRADIEAFLENKTPAQKNALKADTRIAPIIARMQAERTNSVDTMAMLEELEGAQSKVKELQGKLGESGNLVL